MEDKHRIYEQAALGGRVGFGNRAAVVVVDFQRCFVDPSIPGGGDFSDAIEETVRLLEAGRSHGVPIVFTVVAYDDPARDAGRFIEKCPTLKYAVAGSEMVELDERLGRRPDEPVVVKSFASAFFGTTVASYLTGLGVDTVILAGCTTSGCVRASAIDSMQSGFRTVIPRQCVGDIAAEPHEANLFDIDAKYGDVVDLDVVLAALPAPAGNATTG
ncbi:MAG: isochorismatase family protein [Acidimicrobiia bacterium]|nr:isochorismatase family protein [Acidimicrobiia bacterium]MYE68000.1 isochorismatase family protein [Acidimicrobiia bacterium]MYJ14228.1 isochorismatase family protein [Acidimicrobiia bacterium]